MKSAIIAHHDRRTMTKKPTMRSMPFNLLSLLLFIIALSKVYCADDDAYNGDDAAGDDVYSTSQQLVQPCENGIIQVTGISLLCNSPYTYYWGNNAKRNSDVCDYGDKAQIEVAFTVTENLDTDIYMLMAVSYGDEQLYLGESVELCYNNVGYACSSAGNYVFKKKIQFAYLDGSYTNFVPTLEIAFSDSNDGAYTLGGVNIDCQEYDQNEDGEYVDWTTNNSDTSELSPVRVFFMNYGILLGTVTVVAGFSLFLWYNNRKDGPSQVTAENKEGLLA